MISERNGTIPMKLIYKILHKDPEDRDDVIAVTSGLGIAVNLFIAAAKIVIGALASSIAIISEGANNASDALSSVLALVGTKIAGKHPDKKHPFGYRRLEYITGLVISSLIIVTGIEMLIGSVKQIVHPEKLGVSYLTIVIIAVTAIIKFFLAVYTVKMGNKTGSSSLVAVGKEGQSDSIASVITIVSSLIFLIFGFSVDGVAGILISALILKAGYGVLKETLSELIGRAGEKELADALYEKIKATDGIIGAADMMLHNYGPDTWSGSVNVEMDRGMTVGEIYSILHALQLKIMHEHSVVMVFGIYAVDNDNAEIKAIRDAIGAFVGAHSHVKGYHAVYSEPETGKIYCDLVVDYELADWEELKKEFTDYMKGIYPGRDVELTVETEYV